MCVETGKNWATKKGPWPLAYFTLPGGSM